MADRKKIWRCLAVLACAVLILGIALNIIVPRLIGKAAVREKIIALISEETAGTVEIRDAEMAWFPRPRLIVHQARLTIPGKFEGTFETIEIFPKLWPLITGNVKFSRLQLKKPFLTIMLPDHTEEKKWSLEEIALLLRSISLSSQKITIRVQDALISLVKSPQAAVTLKGLDMQAVVINSSGGVKITLQDLRSAVPKLRLSVTFMADPALPLISLDLRGQGIDVPAVRAAALTLADDVPVVYKIFDILRSGTVEDISFQSKGSSPGDLGKTANMKIKGRLDKGGILLSRLGLDFRDVSGDCKIEDGILQGSNLKGGIMHTRISDGKLRVGLKGKDVLLHLDAAVSADMTDVHAVLNRLVKNPEFHQELGRVSVISGNAEGRLVLGESLTSVRAKVDISKMKFSSNYDRIPLPIAIDQGIFSYDSKGVAVKNLAGTVGKSAFSGFSASIKAGDRWDLEIKSGTAHLDAGEVHRWLSSYEKLKEPLRKIALLNGRVDLSSVTFQGPVMDSQAWNFKISGSAEKLMINTSLLPGPLAVNSGTFNAQAGQLAFSDARIGFLDASPVVSGSLNASLENVSKGDIRLSGKVGPEAFQWIKTAFSIPEYIRTDQTISVSGAHLTWQEKGGIAFQGAMKTETGQSIEIDLTRRQKSLTISKLIIEDALSHAAVNLESSEKEKSFGFSGRLDTSTTARLVTTPQIQGGMMQGEFSASFSPGSAVPLTAKGRLRGEKIVLPWKKDLLLTIDSVALTADGKTIAIDSAMVRLADNSFSLKGNVASRAEGLVMDMDVSSDRIVWQTLAKALDKEDRPAAGTDNNRRDRTLLGTLRLKADTFHYDTLTLTGLQTDIEFRPGLVSAAVNMALYCDMAVTGSVTQKKKDLSIDLHVSARDSALRPAVACVTDKNAEIDGIFDLDAHIVLHGKAGIDPNSLHGDLDFRAKDGRIHRFTALAKVLSLLNVTEIFRGRIPDFVGQGFAYRSFVVKGDIQKGKLLLKEGRIDSQSMGIVGDGTIDLISRETEMTLLVAPFRTIDAVLNILPGWKGGIVSIPFSVTGSLKDPQVEYMSSSVVRTGLTGFMENLLMAPIKLFLPDEKK